jgi:hypothetical protein
VQVSAVEVQVPQVPPQPSLPQTRPAQSGMQSTQRPSVVQAGVAPEQAPQVPPQPSLPQIRSEQSG